jgi:vesicle transport through interaction with t-SNAREs protein 1
MACYVELYSFPPQKDLRADAQRSELLSGPGFPPSDDPDTDEDPSAYSSRTRLLRGTETLEDGSRRLDNAQRIAMETEDVGADILRNLRGQREQIEHTRDSVSRGVFACLTLAAICDILSSMRQDIAH